MLPQPSVASHVRVITWLPAQLPGASASLEVSEATPLQSSEGVGVPVAAGRVDAVQSIATFAGQSSEGPWVSVTVIVC